MATKSGINGKDLIEALLELTGKEYCRKVKSVTVKATVDDAVIVTVEMQAEEE